MALFNFSKPNEVIDEHNIKIDWHTLNICYSESYFDEDAAFLEVKFHMIDQTAHFDTHLYLNIDFTDKECSNVLKICKDSCAEDYVITTKGTFQNFETEEERNKILFDLIKNRECKIVCCDDKNGYFNRVL